MRKHITLKVGGMLLGITGSMMILAVILPLFTYQFLSSDRFQKYLSPVPEEQISDFTKVSSWFTGSIPTAENATSSVIRFYNISIPKLQIQNATVSVGGEDLADSLIQYPGTALPGKRGNAVIFGHSVLPAFFDPKDYLSIFSTLPSMKKKDEIKIEYDGVEYMYRVADMYEVLPTNLDVLSQNTDESYISLITCVPPGDPRRPKRLVVRAKLVPPSERSLSYTQ